MIDSGLGGVDISMGRGNCFKGRQFTAEVILWAVRLYPMFPVSYRDLELMLLDRGVEVDHTTIFRWLQAYAGELEKRVRPHLRRCNGSWRVDETYVRDTVAAKRFFRKALAQPHVVSPRTVTVDKNPAYPRAATEMKRAGEL
jgi:transposase-like protein